MSEAWSIQDAGPGFAPMFDRAIEQVPQRIRRGHREVVVVDADEYARLQRTAAQALPLPDGNGEACDCAGGSLVQALRDSPWRWEVEAGVWPYRWDWSAHAWAPVCDVDGGAESGDAESTWGSSFLDFMQRSPLAEAFREGDISVAEWDELMRRG